MKNIDRINSLKQAKLPSKVEKTIQDTNKLLRKDLQDNKYLNLIKRNFQKIFKYAKFFGKKIETVEEFDEFLLGLKKVLNELEIEKIYNSTTIKNLGKFDKLDLLSQFFYISAPIYNNPEGINLIKGGVCYHWSIFFYNLFNEIDKNNKFEKKLLLFGDNYHHSAFLVGFKNKKYIIDPYAKSNGLITEVKKGNKVYIGAVMNEIIFAEITNTEKLTLKNGKEIIKPKLYKAKHNFIKNINDSGLHMKIYINGKATWLSIKDLNDYLIINFDGYFFQRDKFSVEDDIMFLYMEKLKRDNYNILLALLGLEENLLNKETKHKLKVLSSKLDKDYLIEKLGLKDSIKIFE